MRMRWSRADRSSAVVPRFRELRSLRTWSSASSTMSARSWGGRASRMPSSSSRRLGGIGHLQQHVGVAGVADLAPAREVLPSELAADVFDGEAERVERLRNAPEQLTAEALHRMRPTLRDWHRRWVVAELVRVSPLARSRHDHGVLGLAPAFLAAELDALGVRRHASLPPLAARARRRLSPRGPMLRGRMG